MNHRNHMNHQEVLEMHLPILFPWKSVEVQPLNTLAPSSR